MCVHPISVNHASKARRPDVVVPKVRTSRLTLSPEARRTHATTVSLLTSRPAHRECTISTFPSILSRSAWGPRHRTLKSMLQERCRPFAQSGVIKAPRVQLENGLLRTKQKPTSLPTLHDNTSSRRPQKSFIPGGSVQPVNN